MKSMRLSRVVLMAVLTITLAGTALAKEKVTIFHTGGLSVPFAKIEADFEAMHPNIDIQREAGGSTKMARMISELGKPADIMAPADFKVIDKNLIPTQADWNIRTGKSCTYGITLIKEVRNGRQTSGHHPGRGQQGRSQSDGGTRFGHVDRYAGQSYPVRYRSGARPGR